MCLNATIDVKCATSVMSCFVDAKARIEIHGIILSRTEEVVTVGHDLVHKKDNSIIM